MTHAQVAALAAWSTRRPARSRRPGPSAATTAAGGVVPGTSAPPAAPNTDRTSNPIRKAQQ